MMGDTIRLYFAPITGAIKGARLELRRVDREIARERQIRNQLPAERTTKT